MINKLIEKIRKTNAPIVVGLDPMLNYIPKHIQENAFAEFGETLEGAAEAIWFQTTELRTRESPTFFNLFLYIFLSSYLFITICIFKKFLSHNYFLYSF